METDFLRSLSCLRTQKPAAKRFLQSEGKESDLRIKCGHTKEAAHCCSSDQTVRAKLMSECHATPRPVLAASIFPLPTHRPTPVLPILGVRPTPRQTQLNPAPARLTGKTSFPPSSDLFPQTKPSRQALGPRIPQLIPPHHPASSYNSSLAPPGPQTHD